MKNQPSATLQHIPYPECSKKCATIAYLGVKECCEICLTKFDEKGKPVIPAKV